jgi:hypothetical protein
VVEFTGLFWVTTAAKLVALILGSFIVYLAYTGYRRNAAKPLLYTSIGFALITLGTIAEGIIYVILGADLMPAIATGTTITVLGFLVIIYSIYSVKAPSSSKSVGTPKSVTSTMDSGQHE